jgi:SAM-dependent methyltransferase
MPSFDRPNDPDIPASPWITRFAPLVRSGGHILDVAAGYGRHTRHFLGQGYKVTAVDIDVSGMSDLKDQIGLILLEVDLEMGDWPFPESAFDGIVVTNYLHRPHFPQLIDSLAADGVLIFETFGQGNEKLGRPRNPNFLLESGELLRAFGDNLNVVAYELGSEQTPRPAVRQRLCATKRTDAVPLN